MDEIVVVMFSSAIAMVMVLMMTGRHQGHQGYFANNICSKATHA